MALSHVDDPDLRQSLTQLGMIENIAVDGLKVSFDLVLTTPACPMKNRMSQDCVDAIHEYVDRNAEVTVNLTSRKVEQPNPSELFPNIRHTILVASGKGGVGKSTVAVNLAVSLARRGYKVGLADADVYGPSVPKMTGTEGQMPQALEDEQGAQLILPLEKYGVKWMSIGYFASPEQALIWRGPMACNALKQIILQVQWGELDYLLIDLPPGTGDIHITLVNDIPVDGAIIVTTPQAVALADVEKGINMFRNPKIDKHIYGIIENMAWFTPAELPDNRYYIFGRDGSKAIAAKYGIDILAQIPLVQSICEKGDEGAPEALDANSLISKALDNIVL